MPPAVTRRKLRQRALQVLDTIFAERNTVRSIHYSCESFYKENKRTSFRVTAIGVYSFKSNQSEGFSIANTAEILKIPELDIESRFEEVERRLLEEFYSLVKKRDTDIWVHWNMRDTYYGFSALEHRARVLGIDPVPIEDSKKIDLSKVILDLEGPDYIRGPRLQALLEKNDLLPRDFLSGEDEAKAFDEHEYVKLHSSTLSKVRAIWKVAAWAASGELCTETSWLVRHGRRPKDIGWAFADHWASAPLSILFGLVGVASLAIAIGQCS